MKKETEFSVSVGTLDNSDGLTIAGQLFMNSHPDWGPIDCGKITDVHDELLAHYSGEGDK